MKQDDGELREAFVAAYPTYVAESLTALGVQMDAVLADAVVDGVGVLDGLLRHLEVTPVLEQRSSPLEIFRESLRPIDRALTLLGVPTPSGGSAARSIAPWDRYGLAPGSSQVLGEAAHEAHLRWGFTKAVAMSASVDDTAGPALGVFASLDDRDAIVPQAERSSYRTVVLPSDRSVSVVVASADELGVEAIVRSMAARSRVIVFGSNITDLDQIKFMSLGVSSTVDRRVVLGDLQSVLPPLV
ncbi:MAG: hypothetical protein M3132_02080 [Actinomycetia bacterium]|nr:hypothetical protein [Actinomycetes bacterium]